VTGVADVVVVKIGGSTLGAHDTTLYDVAELCAAGRRVVIVHGGGAEISRWLQTHQVHSEFVDGLRVTDGATLTVVVAVLAGVVNKQLVAQLAGLGVRALGLCGADGGLLRAEIEDPALGFVGSIRSVDTSLLATLLQAGLVPVVAPVAIQTDGAGGQLLNVNADTVAGEIAAALPGAHLVFLTDVPGVLDGAGTLVRTLTAAQSSTLRATGVLKGGMIPKIDACLRARDGGAQPIIVDGRRSGALSHALGSTPTGTRFC